MFKNFSLLISVLIILFSTTILSTNAFAQDKKGEIIPRKDIPDVFGEYGGDNLPKPPDPIIAIPSPGGPIVTIQTPEGPITILPGIPPIIIETTPEGPVMILPTLPGMPPITIKPKK